MKTRILLLSFIVLSSISAFAQNVPSYVPSNGLVGWWPFNGNANDESGNGNNGTVNGATLTTDRFGLSNKAYSFDGVDDFIEILHSPSLNLPNGTINLWFKTNSNDRMALFCKSNYIDASSENYLAILGYLFPQGGPTGICYFSKYNSNCQPSNGWIGPQNSLNFSDNIYHMMTCVTSQQSVQIYIDAILQSSIATPNPQADTCPNSSLRFGVNWQGDLNFYCGDIDDIGIWNRALSQQEITDLYNGTNANAAESNLSTANVHPNPTTGEITITSNETFLQSYSLYNSLGQLVASGMLNAENTTFSIQEFAPGIYTLQLQGEKNTTLKIVKE